MQDHVNQTTNLTDWTQRMIFYVNSLWHVGQVWTPTSADWCFLGFAWYPHFIHDPVIKSDMRIIESHHI